MLRLVKNDIVKYNNKVKNLWWAKIVVASWILYLNFKIFKDTSMAKSLSLGMLMGQPSCKFPTVYLYEGAWRISNPLEILFQGIGSVSLTGERVGMRPN